MNLTGKQSDFLKIAVAAAGRGDLSTVKEVLNVRPQWLNRVGSHGRTMIWEAAYRGKLTVVEYLFDRGADPNVWGCHCTPLLVDISPYCAATHKNHEPVAKFLANHVITNDVFTSTYLGDNDQVKQALAEDPSVVQRELENHHCTHELTLLHYAVAARQLELVRLFLDVGAEVRRYSTILLKFAIWRNQPQILEALIQAGADLQDDSIPRGGVKSPEIENVLNRYGKVTDVNLPDGGWPPLVYTCRGDRGGNIDRVKELLAAGADINVRNYKGQTALHCASKAGFKRVVEFLLNHGAEVDAVDQQGLTPLATCISSTIKNKTVLREIVELLIARGANIDQPAKNGKTPRDLLIRRSRQSAWQGLAVTRNS